MRLFATAVVLGASVLALGGSQPPSELVTRASGGSIQTRLSAGIILNEDSSLHREWIAIHDPGLPAKLVGTPGARTIYEDRGYRYAADFTIEVAEPLAAIEVRFLTFDIWGEREVVLNSTDVQDMAVGSHSFEPRWNVHSERTVSEYYASIAYIVRVRTLDGRVLAANPAPVLAEARRFSVKFTEADLEPGSAP